VEYTAFARGGVPQNSEHDIRRLRRQEDFAATMRNFRAENEGFLKRKKKLILCSNLDPNKDFFYLFIT